MKTLTVTSQRANNYGAVLQAYALQRAQEQIGYSNELLRYYETSPILAPIDYSNAAQIPKTLAMNIFALPKYKQLKRFQKKFDEFRDECLHETRLFTSIDDLRQEYPRADCFITGSDQVWNYHPMRNPFRFLDFGDTKTPRYSFSASLHNYNLTEQEKVYFREKLAHFQGISLREKTAAEYISSFTGYPCQTNMDPVFLLDKNEWRRIEKPYEVPQKFILCYALLGNNKLQETLNNLKRRYNLPIVSLQSSAIRHIKADQFIYDVGPREFIWLIDHADKIVTTSFHGTAFSVIFEKQFYSLTKAVLSERATDLMRLLKLENRIINIKTDNIPDIEDVDYSYATEVIEIEKVRSINYLASFKERLN